MMRKLLFVTLVFAIVFSCSKSKADVLIAEATITILHSTCVKTIFKIDAPGTSIGETWSDTTKAAPVTYQHVAQAGIIKNLNKALELNKQYKVKIYAEATGPEMICQMFDPVNSPSIKYDIEFLP